MSRCFPYPPPGFTGKKASDVPTLIDSIKLQKENKANKEKKKEKRRDKGEKKEKKRDKKERKQLACSKQTEVRHEVNKDGKNWIDSELLSQKRKREDTEQLEGSSVTEEHGQPLNVQNPSYSSDGTQNSNKRRKQASVVSDSRGHGNIIRIKLPFQKPNESESKVSKDQLDSTSARHVQNKESDVKASKEYQCSTSGRNEMYDEEINPRSGLKDLFVHPGQDVNRASQGDASLTLLRRNNSLQSCPSTELCSTSGKVNDFAQGPAQTTVTVPGSCSTSGDKKMQKKILKYDTLIQSLYQMAVPAEVVDKDDEDWLFGGKSSDTVVKKRNAEKQFPVNSSVTCSGSSTQYPLCPRAQYLEEAKIYALPYTVPF